MEYNQIFSGDVIPFLEDIQERVGGDFKVYVGGGFIRDKMFGNTPKDLDVFFIPTGTAKQVGYIPPKCYVNYNKSTLDLTDTSDMKTRGVAQVVGLFNSHLTPCEVQFIVYDKFLTGEQLAEDFDMNINQVVFDVDNKATFMSDAFDSGHTDGVIECLHDYDKTRTYERYIRMSNRYPSYERVGCPEVPEKYLFTSDDEVLSESTGSFQGEDE